MWTATIVSRDLQDDGTLLVGVQYSNGGDSFSESMEMTGLTFDFLNDRIADRLDKLNANAALVTAIDAAIKNPQPIISLKLQKAQAQQLVDQDLPPSIPGSDIPQ